MTLRTVRLAVVMALLVAGPARADEVVSGHLKVEGGAVVATITIAQGWHVNAHDPNQKFLIPTVLRLDPGDLVELGDVQYPEPVVKHMSFSEQELRLYEGTVTMRARVRSGTAAHVTGELRYQACNDTTCLPPRMLVLSTDEPVAAADVGGNAIASFAGRWGWGPTFAMVLLLGVGLNLTPCVYPLISVTLAYFGGRTGSGEERDTLRLAGMYVLGICITFSALGAAAALSGSLFGAALQRPAVLGGIALVMVALALANFGVWRFRVPSGLMQLAGRSGDGAFGALFMGLTMGIVGAPCIGPIVAALLLFVGARQSVPLGLALFFVLGLGLGLPYLGLAMLAGRIRRLPRGGEWLSWVEGLFGFVLLGIAVHFATPLLPAWAVAAGWAIVIGSGGVVLGILRPIGGPAVRVALRLAGAAAVAYGVAVVVVPERGTPIEWTPYSDARLVAARDAGRPVLIDFQATWCLPCREMEQTTFRDEDVIRAAARFLMLKADVTAQDESAEAVMKRFAVPGVPTYLVFDSAGREATRFVGFVKPDAMAAALESASGTPERG
jgi:thioredoxin:protein disulfide reductase